MLEVVQEEKFKIMPFDPSDGVTFFKWYHDPAYGHYFRGFVHGATLEQCINAPALLRANIRVAVTDKETRIGCVSLAETQPILRVYRLGLLVDKDYQHTGVGKRLLEDGVDWAFNTMNAHKVYVEVLAGDTRVLAGAKSFGFKEEGVLRQNQYLDGALHDEVTLGILRSEYKNN